MSQALLLAHESIGQASPNPRVGCVLVRDGLIVGAGAHYYDRKDHAEIVALREAGDKARGATAYVTLEPCSHTGRTGPCAEALARAGVERVVIATGDPNPLVNGKGVELLRAAGVQITTGILTDKARAINDGFARWIRKQLPFVTLKAGLSLDGRIAPPPATKAAGSVAYLTGAHSLLAVQKMRLGSDAVLTGIGTVLEDNPLLTDRSGSKRRRPLLRVVLDSELRLPLGCQLVETAAEDVLVCTTDGPIDSEKRARWMALEAKGVQVRAVRSMRDKAAAEDVSLEGMAGGTQQATSQPGADAGQSAPPQQSQQRHGLDLRGVLHLLAEQYRVLNLLVEGGSRLNRALLDNGEGTQLADKLCLFYAPMFLGEQGVPLLAGGMPLPVEIRQVAVSDSGSDLRLDAYLRDPWRDG
ncbi:bifunctional diaminohydroxyphosphoribosylaminopyrimidine deaminase/5-amino-6-(5-phosphoribosylamino)uracil reductase RibD [Acidipila sp. EB88]|uniref:bifunctional diaminohydroxyphosphoribosylaminopyrimidine deaminase/5-amino-6-(5-phosphoribosylamino)uracil reductase RibD n=1 Tax=Acidipila sp. EB88 TaxID=2305226 RepID=UPI00131588F7|nr:bifunctional diaminohydroxyphosphoribosylaminopyrimidine deaminase/5-amino-6-(5-phosphoribosylamino)uracil reductase RibD [Acidipila sp. EB88]